MKALVTTKTPISIHFFDVDPMNVVWHGNYPRFLEMARVTLMEKLNYSYAEMQASGYMWPIVDMRIKYVRPIMLHHKIIVEAALMEYENRFLVDYRIHDEATGDLLTKATTIQVAVKEGNSTMEMESPAVLINLVKGVIG